MEQAYKLEFPASAEGSLFTTSCGLSKTEPLHSFGPAVKPFYLIHVVLSGKGRFISRDKEYHLSAGYGFLIAPDELCFYEADEKEPWTYVWVGFTGAGEDESVEKLGITPQHPVFRLNDTEEIYSIVKDMMGYNTSSFADKLRRNGDLALFLSEIAKRSEFAVEEEDDKANSHVQKAVDFVRMNYCDPIRVTDIADYVCINRSYLYTLFEQYLHISPQQFLTLYRITKSLELLHATDYPIESIAFSCGYTDVLVFTKAFKRTKGMSPSTYRKEMKAGGAESSKKQLKELEEFIANSIG